MANAGMDIKNFTLNVYTHASFDHAAEQMTQSVDLNEQRGRDSHNSACIWKNRTGNIIPF
jgi:hypothetical protein